MSKEIEQLVEAWSKQGRTEEQIYGVKNFLSGLGRGVYSQGYKDGLKKAMGIAKQENCRQTCDTYYFIEQELKNL